MSKAKRAYDKFSSYPYMNNDVLREVSEIASQLSYWQMVAVYNRLRREGYHKWFLQAILWKVK